MLIERAGFQSDVAVILTGREIRCPVLNLEERRFPIIPSISSMICPDFFCLVAVESDHDAFADTALQVVVKCTRRFTYNAPEVFEGLVDL